VPAIQPARLRHQVAQLREQFDDPPAFIRSLHFLLDFYSDRARRPGKTGKPGPLLNAYNVRSPVLRMLAQELNPLLQENPAGGLALCDALWAEAYLEFRLLAAMLLGQIPPEPAEAITDRLKGWITTDVEFFLIEALLNHGVERLQHEQPRVFLDLIESWMENTKTFQQQLGLRALVRMINDPTFENLPVFFRLIQPLCLAAPAVLRPDLLDVLSALARRSPGETAYFLRQSLMFPDAPDTPWLIRQSLSQFPVELQNSLRQAMREAETLPGKTSKQKRQA
jgi:DNA alkylation repair enzyme